jgi:Flp pilus assembly secretin CpaC
MLRRPHSLSVTVSAKSAVNLALIALLGASAFNATKAQADDLVVRYDQAQLLRLPRPVAEIIVGNPTIADVAIQGANLLVVTGKTFGVTNVIALDADRNIIQDQRVVVERDQAVVNLHRGVTRQTYNCTPQCQPNLTIGDDKNFFELISTQNSQKTSFSDGGAAAEKGGQ